MSSYRIPEIAKPYIDYDMITQHTELPRFPDFRARLLFSFLNRSSALAGTSELFSLVTSLVQLGLDTHDLVSNHSTDKEMKAARSRQLKVLAGDYFSSRFYHLLSQAGQIDMISKLSNAICEANRLKMNLYLAAKRLKLTSEEYFGLSVDIRKSLFLSFTGLFEGLLLKLWPEVLQSVTSAEVLLNEINRIEINQDYVGSWGYWLVLQNGTKEECKLLKHDEPDPAKIRLLLHKYKVPAQLYQMLETELAELQKLASELGSDKLAGELNYIVEPMRRFLEAPKAMEEV